MAQKKEHKIVDAHASSASKGAEVKASAQTKSEAKTKRIIAWVFWIFAFACEVLAFLVYSGKVQVFSIPTMTALIAFIVLDLVLVIVGAQFWKKANHMDPISEANKAKFWLWNNMGVIVCCFAFIPFIILALTQKDADPKLKKVAVIAAAAALLIGGAASYDYNPVSEEGVAAAEQALGETEVYWTQYGKKYHTHEDCQYLNRSDVLYNGTVTDAVNEGKSTICSACAKKDNLQVGENGAVSKDTAAEVVEAVEEAVTEETPAA